MNYIFLASHKRYGLLVCYKTGKHLSWTLIHQQGNILNYLVKEFFLKHASRLILTNIKRCHPLSLLSANMRSTEAFPWTHVSQAAYQNGTKWKTVKKSLFFFPHIFNKKTSAFSRRSCRVKGQGNMCQKAAKWRQMKHLVLVSKWNRD